MPPIVAHHAGEQALAPLLLLASGGVPLLVAMTRERLTAVSQWRARSRDRRAGCAMPTGEDEHPGARPPAGGR